MGRVVLVGALIALSCTGCHAPTPRAETIHGRWVSVAFEGEDCGDFVSTVTWVFRPDASYEATATFRLPQAGMEPIHRGTYALEAGRLFAADDTGDDLEIGAAWRGDELLLSDAETGCTVVLRRDE